MLRIRRAAVLTVALWCVIAPPALAHKGNPNFRSTVREITPAVKGIDVQVVRFDDSIALLNRSGQLVVVKGYRGEPYVRIAADGAVAVNSRSPSYYLNDDRFAEGVKIPADATPSAPPEWQAVDQSGRFTWHDHRIHWMAHSLPPQVKDTSKKTKVFDWKVPIEVGDQPATIAGTLTWVGKPGGGFPMAAAISLALAVLAGGGLVVLVRRRRKAGATPGGAAKEAW